MGLKGPQDTWIQKDFSQYSWAIGLTSRRCLRGALAVWRLIRKTARMPDLATFSTGDSKVLLRLGEKLLEAYIKGENIIEMYQVFLARMFRHRPWRHNLPVAWEHLRLKCSMCDFHAGQFVMYPDPEVLGHVSKGQNNAFALDHTWAQIMAARFKPHYLCLRCIQEKAKCHLTTHSDKLSLLSDKKRPQRGHRGKTLSQCHQQTLGSLPGGGYIYSVIC